MIIFHFQKKIQAGISPLPFCLDHVNSGCSLWTRCDRGPGPIWPRARFLPDKTGRVNPRFNVGEAAGQVETHCHCHVIPRSVRDVKEPRGRDIRGCTGEKGGSGFLGCLSGRYIRLVIKSPQFRLILAKEDDQDCSRSQEIANYRSLF